MQKYHDEPRQYKGYLKSALTFGHQDAVHETLGEHDLTGSFFSRSAMKLYGYDAPFDAAGAR